MINKIDKFRYMSMPQEKINEVFLTACKDGNLELVEYLLLDEKVQNAEISYQKYDGLFQAARFKKNHIVDYLLTSRDLKDNPSVNLQNGNLLFIATTTNNYDLVDYLMDAKKNKRIQLNSKNEHILKSLMSNFKTHQDMIKYLLVNYDIEKTEEIANFLDEKNRDVQEKRLVNEWFEKRDLMRTMKYVFEEDKPKEKSKTKKNKI